MKRFRKALRGAGRWGLRGLVVLVVLGAVAALLINWRGSVAREAALQAMADAGIEMPPKGWVSREGDTYNGGALMQAAMRAVMFPSAWGEDAPVFSTDEAMQTAFGEPISPEVTERLIRFRERVEPVLELVGQAAAADHFAYDAWPYLNFMRLDDLSGLRQVARTVQSAAMADEAEGDFDAALDRYRQLVIINASVAEIPTVIVQLVRISIDALVREAVQDTVSRGTASLQSLAALRAVVVEADSPDMLEVLLEAQAIENAAGLENVQVTVARQHAYMVEWLDYVADMPESAGFGIWQPPSRFERVTHRLADRFRVVGVWFCPGWEKLRWAGSLEQTLAWRDVLSLPVDERAQRITVEAEADKGMDDSLAPMLRTGLAQQATLRLMATGLAVEGYRVEHGNWPESPTELDNAWMIDPFDGQPLRYRHTDEGVMVYSIGRDLEDDGGEDDFRDGDMIFRLLDPDRRGTASR